METVIPIGISLPNEVVKVIDSRRNDIPRSKFILRILERALNAEGRRGEEIHA